jgi:ADP-ribose pyrophosphatase YjhB (NUDIX family)
MENKILDLFLYNNKLKFNEIEKLLNARSNKLTYHLKSLVKKNILSKDKEFYSLSETSESIIPYLSEKKAVLPTILIQLGNEKESFLICRKKRPFKDKLSLPGGRILIGESIEHATKRIMKDKFNINVRFKKINSISLEHVKKSSKILHSFFLVFVSASIISNQKIALTNIENNKKAIISSDYKLIKEDTKEEAKIKTIYTKA